MFMGIGKLIAVAVAFAILAVSTGRLPQILNVVQIAQIQLIHDWPASKWGRAMLPFPTERVFSSKH